MVVGAGNHRPGSKTTRDISSKGCYVTFTLSSRLPSLGRTQTIGVEITQALIPNNHRGQTSNTMDSTCPSPNKLLLPQAASKALSTIPMSAETARHAAAYQKLITDLQRLISDRPKYPANSAADYDVRLQVRHSSLAIWLCFWIAQLMCVM